MLDILIILAVSFLIALPLRLILRYFESGGILRVIGDPRTSNTIQGS